MSRSLHVLRLVVVGLISLSSMTAWAAKPINLRHYSVQKFASFASVTGSFAKLHSETDSGNILHTRYQQTYQGIPVWGGDIVKHQPTGKSLLSSRATMNGMVYQGLAGDLTLPAAHVFTPAQQQSAIQEAIRLTEENIKGKTQINTVQSVIYVDDENKAHWAYQLALTQISSQGLLAQPIFIMDAITHKVYETWNDLKRFDRVNGGGFGGNPKEGEFIYDSLAQDAPELDIRRDAAKNICYLQNTDVIVKDARHGDEVSHFACAVANAEHNNIYWDADFDAINDAYSPSNDALYFGKVIKSMWQDWYQLPVLTTPAGKPMPLVMRVHLTDYTGQLTDDAYWANGQVNFGDGSNEFYPLTTLEVASHEFAHGFTDQHSRLAYRRQSGGINESFSDMAAKATEYYLYHQNSWEIGADVMKAKGQALRYMDDPTKDCHGSWLDECSISNADEYRNDMDVHNSSGIFNKVFYLLSTTQGWDTQKAFNVMVQANRFHWTSNTSFDEAACDVVSSARELGYNTFSVAAAFEKVNIDVGAC